MTFIERHCDIFQLEELGKYPNLYYVHCVSADLAMGAGIAVEFDKRFHIKETLDLYWPNRPKIVKWPSCFMVDRAFSLVTKERYFHKPTCDSMEQALLSLAEMCDTHDVKILAMPHIGCGLDQLEWGDVKPLIYNAFIGMRIHIIACEKPNT